MTSYGTDLYRRWVCLTNTSGLEVFCSIKYPELANVL